MLATTRTIGGRSMRFIVWWLTSILVMFAAAMPGVAEDGTLDRIMATELQQVFPDAQQVGPFEGTPPAAPIYRDGRVVGYAASTLAAVRTTGYSGKPLDVLFGINLDGVITGARLRQHTEPILVIGVSEAQLTAYVDGFRGISLKAEATPIETSGLSFPPVVAGATVSSAVIRDGIIRAAKAVALSRGILGGDGEHGTLDRATFEPVAWKELLADGSIVFRRFTESDIGAAADSAAIAQEADERLFIELYLALLLPPRIGENLLGPLPFNRLVADLKPADQAIMIAANGRYSFKGTGFVRTGRFDRIQIVQAERTIPLITENYRNVEQLAIDGTPEMREIGVFVIPAESGFDPLAPWRLDLMISDVSVTDAAKTETLGVSYLEGERKAPRA
jgi:transcriptional regulator of nitric oxide reductase